MSTPHVCPICKGTGEVKTSNAVKGISGTIAWKSRCHACSGTGVVWEPESHQYASYGAEKEEKP